MNYSINGKLGTWLKGISFVGSLLLMTITITLTYANNQNDMKALQKENTTIKESIKTINAKREEQVELNAMVKILQETVKQNSKDIGKVQQDTSKILGILQQQNHTN